MNFSGPQKCHPQQIKVAMSEFSTLLEDHKNSASSATGAPRVATGFRDLDSCIGEFRPGTLTVIASSPSGGKTALALNIAAHVCLSNKTPVLLFSMDLSSIAISTRLVSHVAKIESWKFRDGSLDQTEQGRFELATSQLAFAPLFIDETNGLTVEEVISKVRQTVLQVGRIGLIVIDHLQLMEPLRAHDCDENQYEAILSALNELACEAATPIILLSTLDANLEIRQDKRPCPWDLPKRAIERFSDLLIFLYRDEMYAEHSENAGTAEIIISKNRYGSTGVVLLDSTHLKYGGFENMSHDDLE